MVATIGAGVPAGGAGVGFVYSTLPVTWYFISER